MEGVSMVLALGAVISVLSTFEQSRRGRIEEFVHLSLEQVAVGQSFADRIQDLAHSPASFTPEGAKKLRNLLDKYRSIRDQRQSLERIPPGYQAMIEGDTKTPGVDLYTQNLYNIGRDWVDYKTKPSSSHVDAIITQLADASIKVHDQIRQLNEYESVRRIKIDFIQLFLLCFASGATIFFFLKITRKTLFQLQDLSEQQRAYSLAVESHFKQLRNEAPIPIYATLGDGIVIDANPAFFTLTGFTLEALQAGHITEGHITPRDFELQESLRNDELQKIGRYGPYEKDLLTSEGGRVPVIAYGYYSRATNSRCITWHYLLDQSQLHSLKKAS